LSLGRPQPARNLFGLLNILIGGTPEEQASGNFSDRHRDTKLCGNAQDAVFHRGRAGARRDRHVDGLS
jgi:hypothetical protein